MYEKFYTEGNGKILWSEKPIKVRMQTNKLPIYDNSIQSENIWELIV